MANDFGVVIAGDREVELAFDDGIPQALHGRLKGTVDEYTHRLEGIVLARVPRRTGKLAGEVVSFVRDTPDYIHGGVTMSGDYAKAGALEYGVHGSVHVKAHEMRLMHVFDHALSGPLIVFVQALERPMDLTARRYERGALAEIEPQVQAAFEQAVSQATESVAQ